MTTTAIPSLCPAWCTSRHVASADIHLGPMHGARDIDGNIFNITSQFDDRTGELTVIVGDQEFNPAEGSAIAAAIMSALALPLPAVAG